MDEAPPPPWLRLLWIYDIWIKPLPPPPDYPYYKYMIWMKLHPLTTPIMNIWYGWIPPLTMLIMNIWYGWSKLFVLNFWNIQSFGPLKTSREPKNQVFPMFLTFVTSIFLIFGLFPGIAKIWVLTNQLLEDLTGSFFNLQDPWIPFIIRGYIPTWW